MLQAPRQRPVPARPALRQGTARSMLSSEPPVIGCASDSAPRGRGMQTAARHSAFDSFSAGSSSANRRLSSPAISAKRRSEEHTSELQSLMRISSAVLCLKKKKYKLYIVTPSSQLSYHTHTITPKQTT